LKTQDSHRIKINFPYHFYGEMYEKASQ